MSRNDLCEAEFETIVGMNSTKWTPSALKVLETLDNIAFRPEAQRYLGLTVKPDLPEEARMYRIQAEAAVERKSFVEATDRYRDTLRVAPWWPEGHYNRALLLAELGRHALAVREMKRYLLLAPGAPDARAAQDQIYKWEALVKR
jgi:regulator of sirC expression with transglutaminase-like and TPR domain